MVACGHNRAGLRAGAVLLAALVCALAVLLARSQEAPAEDLQAQISSKQQQIDAAKSKEGVLSTDIKRLSDRINTLEGEVSALRNREAAVQADLEAKQAELKRAVAELKRAKRRLVTLRAHLRRAVNVLEKRLVDIYKSDQPDVIDVILQSNGYKDLLERTEYLGRIQDSDSSLVDRVRQLRDQTRRLVTHLTAVEEQVREARDAIAAKRRELAETRSSLESQQGQLSATRGQKAGALDSVRDDRRALEGDLSDLSAKVQAQLAQSASGGTLPAGPIQQAGAGFIWPVNGPVVSGFGMRWGRLHAGIDIAVPTGTPIRAAKSGVVALASPYGGYGNYTCVNHGGGLSTCYAHQTSFATSSGASVKQGQVIGYVGCTGHCFGPHLHFEVRINGAPVDPLGYL